MFNSKIIGLGKYLPENIVTNADLEKIMETSDAWIQERTGIEERRHIAKGDGNSTSMMGVKAARIAIERAGLVPQDIDFILFATLSPDYYFPGSGVLVQEALEIPDCPAMDIRMQCSGFVYAVATADQFIKTGMYKNVLVIGSEYHSGGLDMTTRGRNISVIFGDGAGAVILKATTSEKKGFRGSELISKGEYNGYMGIYGGGTKHPIDNKVLQNHEHQFTARP